MQRNGHVFQVEKTRLADGLNVQDEGQSRMIFPFSFFFSFGLTTWWILVPFIEMGKAWEGTNWGCWVWTGEIKNSLLDIYGMDNRHLSKNCFVCELSSYLLWKLLGNLLILEEWLNIVVLHSGYVWYIYCTSFFIDIVYVQSCAVGKCTIQWVLINVEILVTMALVKIQNISITPEARVPLSNQFSTLEAVTSDFFHYSFVSCRNSYRLI